MIARASDRRSAALRSAVAALLMLLGGSAAASADEGAVEPDRPDVSNGVKTVAPGTVQIESGVDYARTRTGGRAAERRLALELHLRAGLTERVEVKVESEPFVRLRGEEDDTSPGDIAIGVKYRFLDRPEGAWWPALAIQPFVKLPVASAPIGSERPDFDLRALASFDLPAGLGLDVNAGLITVGQRRPSGYLLQALATASLNAEIGERFLPFVEIFYTSRDEREGRGTVGFDAGLVYRITRRVAVDVAVATSLAGNGPDYALRGGLTVRFGR